MRYLRAFAAGLALTLTLTATALADEHVRLSPVGDDGRQRSWILSVPSGSPVDPRAVRAFENGRPVRGLQATPSGAAAGSSTVLVIDASESMHDDAIAGAMRAARRFAERRTGEQRLGVAAFNRRFEVVVPPTTDDAAIARALEGPPDLAPGTNIHDAVGHALRVLGGAGTLVLLSDGDDTGSRLTLQQAVAAARARHVRIFSIGLQSNAFDPMSLRRLADRTGGLYEAATSPEALAPILDALGARLAREIHLTYTTRYEPGTEVALAVDVDGGRPDVSTAYIVPGDGDASRSAAKGFWGSALSMVAVAAGCALLLAVAAGLLLRRPRRRLSDRIGDFLPAEQAATALAVDPGAQDSQRLYRTVDRLLSATHFGKRLRTEIDVSMIPRTSGEIVTWTTGTTLGTSLLLLLAGAAAPGLLVLLLGPSAVWFVIRRRANAQRSKFEDQLADNLQVVASALRAGHSFAGALGSVVEDAPEPARREFSRMRADEQLGVPLEECINRVAERMRNRDLPQVAVVAALQNQTGGNTAEVLDRVVEAVRSRAEVRRMVRTLTAQGRLAHVILTFLPVALTAAIFLMDPNYFDSMLETGTGRVLIAAAAAMVVAGSLAIKRIVNVRV